MAWSLAVEEWFYLLFAPLLFLVGRLVGRSDRRLDAAFAVIVIVAVAALRFVFAPHDWDLDVRRVTLFRIDSIVWGFLLYLELEKRPAPSLERPPEAVRLGALRALLVASRNGGRNLQSRASRSAAASRRSRPFPIRRRSSAWRASAFSGRRTRRSAAGSSAPSASGSGASPTRPISFTS